MSLAEAKAISGEKGEPCPQKKGFGQRTQEKQQIRKTCRRPNRLNLSILTTPPASRSNFLRKLTRRGDLQSPSG
jgi:hypothetical protein